MPVKLTTAPTSVRPFLKAVISCATSKSAFWMRMVAATLMTKSSTAGHRREKCDLAGTGNRRIRLDMGLVDRRANHLRLLEGVGIGLAAARQPGDQFVDGAHIGRRLDGLFRLADPLAHPGKIFHLHPSSSLMR